MRILRSTMWHPAGDEPATIIVRESDVKVPLAAVMEENPTPEMFVTHEIFEIPGRPNIQTASLTALERLKERQETERNMAVLFYYDANGLRFTNPHGMISTTDPSPLSAKDIETTLLALSKHPRYQHQTIICHDEDGEPVTMRDGKIE